MFNNYFLTCSRAADNILVQFLITLQALTAASLIHLIGTEVVSSSPKSSSAIVFLHSQAGVSLSSNSLISKGYNLVIRRFVFPLLGQILAALTKPSNALISFSITVNIYCILGVSSCIRKTLPTLTVRIFVPVTLWTSRREVRYSFFHLYWKCCRSCVVSLTSPLIQSSHNR